MYDPQAVKSVSQVTAEIKRLLEGQLRVVLLQGEISNFKAQSSGHLYFSLKDNAAQISAVLFRGNAIHLSQEPKNGDQVVVKGELSVYEPRGSYQVVVRELYYVGLGALLLQLQQLKEKLQKLGWFDLARKRPLPKFPKRIGVVTSPTGAVIQDILNILGRRHAGFQLVLNPVKVQGEGAAQEIAKGIEEMNQHQLADVLIVGRGGGSLEDLWAFNEEVVAKAVFESQIPVISAVGHESDTSICDLVADVRAPTPSAAAEIVVSEKKQQQDLLLGFARSIGIALNHCLRRYKIRLSAFSKHPTFTSPQTLLTKPSLRLDELRSGIDLSLQRILERRRLRLQGMIQRLSALRPENELARVKQKLQTYEKNVETSLNRSLLLRKERLLSLVKRLSSIDPKNLLRKGYAILFAQNRTSLIISAKEVQCGDTLFARVADGHIELVVK